jgi:hypothetical protein
MFTPEWDERFTYEEFFEDSMSDIERKHSLEREKRIGTDIQADFAENGPLSMYLKERRTVARDALKALVNVDPSDSVKVATTQTIIREYLVVVQWVSSRLQNAELAKDAIEEEFVDETDSETDGGMNVEG